MRIRTLLAIVLLPMLAFTDTTLKVEDIVVRGRPFFDHDVFHGYIEYHFSVKNNSPSRSREVQVNLVSGNGTDITKTVIVPPGEQVAFPLFSDRQKSHMAMVVTVDERWTKRTTLSQVHSSFMRNKKASLLASKAINQDDLQKQIEVLQGWSSKEFNNNFAIRRTDLPPQEWSGNWQAYSSFDGVVMQQQDFDEMPAPVQSALRQYVESGGVLTVLGGKECPFSGRSVQLINQSALVKAYAAGFGRCYVYNKTNPAKSDLSTWLERDQSEWVAGEFGYDLNVAESYTNEKFPVVEQITIPVRGFLLLVTLFAVIAGPVTIFVLSKINRRIWLLWIIPLESAIACGLVMGYSLLSEGVTPTVRLSDITFLDQERHVATTFGWAGYYCPLRPSDGLFFSDDWVLDRVKQIDWRSGVVATDWTRGQHLSHGWVQARVPTFLMCRRNTIRRERLECSLNSDGKMEVVNGLGADIKTLWLRDAERGFLYAENIKAGQRAVLEPRPGAKVSKNIGRLRNLYTLDFVMAENSLRIDPQQYMVPGSYVATLDGAPFMQHGFGEQKLKLDAEDTVYGLLPLEEAP